MSWSVSAFGKAAAVKAKLTTDLANISTMSEPEETVKQKLGESLLALCDGNPGLIVRAEANGSQWTDKGVSKNSNAQMKFEIIGGFLE